MPNLIPHPAIPGQFRVVVKKDVTARVFRIGDGYWNWVSPEFDVHGGFDSPQEAANAAVRAHKRKSPKRPVDPVAAKMQRDAVRRFGITNDPLEAGYVLSDGRLLDMSGKREGGDRGMRAHDHREVGDGSTDSMWEFMKRCGAIRVHVEDDYLGADLDTRGGFVKPSKKQIDVLTRIAATRSRPPRLVFDGGPLGSVFDIENASAFRRELERALQS